MDETVGDGPAILHHWTARRVQPVVILYVIAVFLGFMALAFFLFHSVDAVKALATTGIGTAFAMLPVVFSRIEYELTETGLRKRPFNPKNPKGFQEVFSWEELDHVVPMTHGFKYFRPVEGNGNFARFWKAHVSGAFSGEFPVEQGDRERVRGLLAEFENPNSELL